VEVHETIEQLRLMHRDKQETIGSIIGKHRTTALRKLNGEVIFYVDEIAKIAEYYSLDATSLLAAKTMEDVHELHTKGYLDAVKIAASLPDYLKLLESGYGSKLSSAKKAILTETIKIIKELFKTDKQEPPVETPSS
jgi:hypothetical protein